MRLNTFLGTLSIRAHAVLILVGWGVPTQFSRLMQGKLLSFSSPWVTDWAFTVSMVTHCASSGNKAFSLKQKKTLQWKLFSKFFLIGSNILFMGRERKASWVWDAAMGMFALEQLIVWPLAIFLCVRGQGKLEVPFSLSIWRSLRSVTWGEKINHT